MKYQVIEDNGGGLSLYVFRGRKVIYSHSGYEINPGQLTNDIAALDSGDGPESWDGCEDDPQGSYDQITGSEYGWQVVASGSPRKLYPGRMGTAACLEFGVSEEEHARAQSAALMGAAKTARKSSAAQENGKKGGRPRNWIHSGRN